MVSRRYASRCPGEPTLIDDSVVERLRRSQEQGCAARFGLGSGKFVQTLIQNDLVDEFALIVHPLVLGTGERALP